MTGCTADDVCGDERRRRGFPGEGHLVLAAERRLRSQSFDRLAVLG